MQAYDSRAEEVKNEKMSWHDQGDMNLMRMSGKGRDERSAQSMKNPRVDRETAHGGKRPPELEHRHFGQPEGGIGFFSRPAESRF